MQRPLFALAATLLLLAPVASADPVTLVDEEVPGYRAVAGADPLVILTPNPGVPGVEVVSDAGHVPVGGVDVRDRELCTTEEALGVDDRVPCALTLALDVTAPCAGLLALVRSLPGTGPAVADALVQAARSADALAEDTALPLLASAGLDDVEWDGRAEDALERCHLATQEIDASGGVHPSSVEVQDLPPVGGCIPREPLCVDRVDLDEEFHNEALRIEERQRVQACDVDGLVADCGEIAIEEVDRTVDPWDDLATIVRSLPDGGAVEVPLVVDGVATPHVWTDDPSGYDTATLLRCRIGGIPSAEDGQFDAFVPFFLVEAREETLPAQDTLDGIVGSGFATLGALRLALMGAWASEVDPALVEAGHEVDRRLPGILDQLSSDQAHAAPGDATTGCDPIGAPAVPAVHAEA